MIPPITRERWCRFWKAVGACSVDETKAIDLYSEILGVYEKMFDDLQCAPPTDWLPLCAGELFDCATCCTDCPFRKKCEEMKKEMDRACGIEEGPR